VALSWADAVLDRCDLVDAWPLTDPDHRLVCAQVWLYTEGREHDVDRVEVADALAAGVDHPDWPLMAAWWLHHWRAIAFRFMVDGWRIVTVEETPGPDLEFIRLAPIERQPSTRPHR
jgi:hypothetical protein